MDRIEKFFARIPKKHLAQILATLKCLRDSVCRKSLKIDALTGTKYLKVRSGRYRILFHIQKDGSISLDDVSLRNESTYKNL